MGMLVGARWQRRGSAGLLGALLFVVSGPARAVGPFETNPPLVERGLKAYDEGRFEDALRDFTAAEQEAPGHPALEYNRGNALYRLGRYDAARDAYRRAADAAGPSLRERDLYNLGNALAQLGDTQAAIGAYRKALVMEPGDEAARHNLEVLLRKIPPPKSQSGDGGTDGGRPDGGRADGGSDGGQGDGGQSGDAGTQRRRRRDGPEPRRRPDRRRLTGRAAPLPGRRAGWGMDAGQQADSPDAGARTGAPAGCWGGTDRGPRPGRRRAAARCHAAERKESPALAVPAEEEAEEAQ